MITMALLIQKILKKNGDAAIKITLKQFCVVDQLDYLFTTVEVYFEIYINGRLEVRIDNNGNSWYATTAETYTVNKEIIFNINDDQRYTDIRIIMMDDDFILEHDPIDIDGQVMIVMDMPMEVKMAHRKLTMMMASCRIV